MSRISRENILASSGNLPVYPAGQPVFSTDGYSNLAPGQLAVWNPVTLLSLGVGATPATNDRIVISVGVDEKNIRSCFGDEIYGNYIQAVTSEGSRCGVTPVWDLLYNCVSCNDEFTISITVSDDTTQNTYPYNKPATYTYTVGTDCCSCSTCTNGIDCHQLSCALVKSINEERSNFLKGSTFLPSRKRQESKGFTAHVLYGGANPSTALNPTTKVYCINPLADACTGSCISTGTLINQITWTDAVAGAQVVPLTFTTNPLNPAETLVYQLQSVVRQINTALNGNGSATITHGTGSCCPYRLEVNTCFNDFAITGLVPCENYNPFDPATNPITLEHNCKNCDVAPTATFSCGIRIIADAIELPCDNCRPDLNPVWMKNREIAVFPSKGFSCGSTYVRQVQPSILPENLGYDWIVKDYLSENGGSGRDHDAYEHRGYGAAGYPLERGRSGGIGNIRCSDTVCSYAIAHTLPHTDPGVRGVPHATRGTTIVLIPTQDAVTRADFEALINAYITANNPIVKATVTCASDQDQIEAPVRYPDSNGYII